MDLPPLRRGDSTVADRVKARKPHEHGGRALRPNTRTAVCPSCGRTWHADSWSFDGNSGRVMGFLVTAANNHHSTCNIATPEERRAIARTDMRRWAKSRAQNNGFSVKQLVVIDFRHPGYGNEPIFDDPALERFGRSISR